MNYTEHARQDRRLVILRMLQETPGYALNDAVLQKSLKVWAHATNTAELSADLDFLKSVRTVSLERLGVYCVITLTRLGEDVADGTKTIKGISRPSAPRG